MSTSTPSQTNVSPKSRPRSFEIVFDGGSLGNPGKGYGSYEITSGGEVVRHEREDYGNNVTNNQAEYLTLIRALEWLDTLLEGRRESATVLINGDSKLVINQVQGLWKINNAQLRPLAERARELLKGYAKSSLVWHARANSVKRLGH
ncbi:MAG TPA: ribonuclease HI family protein [Thermomicrobiales bacterium]|nr:ribonuclease HI family protein [Thermomicrobiales bacterium]